MIALDWKNVFDSINPGVLSKALARFGVPEPMLAAVRGIYASRTFTVADSESPSAARRHAAGISQGCPLSPFLFVMVMSVLMADAVEDLTPPARKAYSDGLIFPILYADDTLLVGYQKHALQSFLDSVSLQP